MRERGMPMNSTQQDNLAGFRIAVIASVLLTANLISLVWFGYFYHYVESDATMDWIIVASSLIASVGLLASILLSMNNFIRLARFLFDIGVVGLLVYLVLIAIRIVELEEQGHYYLW